MHYGNAPILKYHREVHKLKIRGSIFCACKFAYFKKKKTSNPILVLKISIKLYNNLTFNWKEKNSSKNSFLMYITYTFILLKVYIKGERHSIIFFN